MSERKHHDDVWQMWHSLPIRQELPDVQQAARLRLAHGEPGAMERHTTRIEAETETQIATYLQRVWCYYRESKSQREILLRCLQEDRPPPAASLSDLRCNDDEPLQDGVVLFEVVRKYRASHIAVSSEEQRMSATCGVPPSWYTTRNKEAAPSNDGAV